ncbi:YIH1 (YCR059C) [Zygosaccharomyces parabailii]|nr:YIH1 (YCR059C) [Zygosaccharomyces parabailii]
MSDELVALEAIYPELVKRHVEDGSVLWLGVPEREHVQLQVSLGSNYPAVAPSIVDVKGGERWRPALEELLQRVWRENGGEVCLYEFMVGATDVIGEEEDVPAPPSLAQQPRQDPLESWYVSEPIYDRGSTFIGYATKTDVEQVALDRLDLLKTDSKVRRGQHVMCAWRMKRVLGSREIVFQDCDDDGETASGSRMLNLMVAMKVWNVMVVVVRWFNGTHIGPDRFRHINAAARDVMLKATADEQ